MSRLTEKREKPLITGNEEKIEYRLVRSYDSCINKLGKLEDLEEELGCPLEAVVRATRDGIYATRRKWYGTESIEVFEKFNVTFDGYSLWNEDEYPYNYDEIFKISPICNEFRLYDYKKTWWLKEDKSE